MKALITGADGFIGSHLAELLLQKDLKVVCLVHKGPIKNIQHLKKQVTIIVCDITNKRKLETIIGKEKPDYVFHLAAQSFVMPSWKDPEKTFQANILGTFYLLNAIKMAKINPTVVVACSSAEYGLNYKHEIPIKEMKEFRPSSPYAVSKVGTDMVCQLFSLTYGMKVVRARIFNTIGPRKTGSAVADFAMMIAAAEKSGKNTVSVGNLSSVVDFTDVRDNVRALWLLATKGTPGEAYNICTGRGHSIEEVLKKLISYSTKSLKIVTDRKKIRPKEDPIFVGDNTKLVKLGWKPSVTLETTLKDTLEYWRTRQKT